MDNKDLDKIDVYDTAHDYYNELKKGNIIQSFTLPNDHIKLVHLNGLSKKYYNKTGREAHAYPAGRDDLIGYVLDEFKDELKQKNIPYIIEVK